MTSTIEDFKETPYEDARWEVLNEIEDADRFVPMALHRVDEGSDRGVDDMFPDYGGINPAKKMWHLPQELSISNVEEHKEEVEIPRITLTEAEYASLLQEAEQRGFERGSAEAAAGHSEQLLTMKEKVETILKDFQQQLVEHLQIVEQKTVTLSLMIAQKLVTAAVEFNPEYIVHIVQETLQQARTATIKSIRVSPQDFEFIRVLGVDSLKGFEGVSFVADETIRAGCIAETSAGEIDYDLDAAFKRIEEQVVRVTQ